MTRARAFIYLVVFFVIWTHNAFTTLALMEAPKPALIVDPKSDTAFKTIQSAVDTLIKYCQGHQVIFVMPGIYRERVLVPFLACSLSIYGFSTHPSYKDNQVTITASTAYGGNDEGTATLRLQATNVSVYNVNIENTVGPSGRQALAVSSNSPLDGRHAYYGCQFKAYQDVVYADARYTYYSQCKITGAVDVIFSQMTGAWFEQCDIESIATAMQRGHVTASGRLKAAPRTGIVLNRCKIHGSSPQSTYLGRPWRDHAWTLVQNSFLDTAARSEGWDVWRQGDTRIANGYLAEYGNCGPGAHGPRAAFAKTRAAPMPIANFLGDVSWLDNLYMPPHSGGPCS